MDPALLGLIDQFTVAVEPFILATNCCVPDALPEASVQPVQLVSILAVPGEMVRVPLPDVPLLELPPQPATAKARGMTKNQGARRL